MQKAEPYRLTGAAAPLAITSKEQGRQPGSLIAGFVKGGDSAPVAVFPAPKVPADYQPVHRFAEPLRSGTGYRLVKLGFSKSASMSVIHCNSTADVCHM